MSEVIHSIADSLPIWRDAVIASLACIVIGALWLYASLLGEP